MRFKMLEGPSVSKVKEVKNRFKDAVLKLFRLIGVSLFCNKYFLEILQITPYQRTDYSHHTLKSVLY
jgi:hypothetical protein